ncbi:methyltransferase domain-containing protein [Sulfurimonas sp. MAG313]|nr:methyltransferase domain-containing protein [Sulfurimonas sp. MAG313]MDF1881516.1 methyltransferase domain-containing protein [Sulfurimonas sp. MAG313]
MQEDKQRWNEKYLVAPMPKETSEILVENIFLALKGRALDIACGMGRNTHYLADSGFEVDAVDLSDYALEQVKDAKNITKIDADLDTYVFEEDIYTLILKVNYLDRKMFPKIIKALKKEGLFICETFVKTPTSQGYHNPTNPDFHLDLDELPKAFSSLEIISYEEKDAINLRGEKVRIASFVGKKI